MSLKERLEKQAVEKPPPKPRSFPTEPASHQLEGTRRVLVADYRRGVVRPITAHTTTKSLDELRASLPDRNPRRLTYGAEKEVEALLRQHAGYHSYGKEGTLSPYPFNLTGIARLEENVFIWNRYLAGRQPDSEKLGIQPAPLRLVILDREGQVSQGLPEKAIYVTRLVNTKASGEHESFGGYLLPTPQTWRERLAIRSEEILDKARLRPTLREHLKELS